jgi:putative FmdB family regulatory protein
MPTYEYECRKCGCRFERFQSMREKPLSQCPECRGRVKRLLGTGAGFIFKGSGFYSTDYRSSGYREAAKKDTGEGGAKSEPAKSGDTKPSKPPKSESQKAPAKTE